MSGTSLDGVDSVLVDLRGRPLLLGAGFLPYPKSLKAILLALHETSGDELHRAALAGIELSRLYAKAAHRLLEKHGVHAQTVSAIGCHGQTVRHRPGAGYSLQLGNPAWLAERTGITVVADFRSRDIAAGGQGAPLVPAFHAAVFRDSRRHRVIANLGGIANLTDLPRKGPATGFDTGPGNVLLDAWTRERFGRDFDRGGALAARGRPVASLLKRLLADPYFHRSPPKSTGREHFSFDWLRRFSVAEEVYLCGGGVRNHDLVMRITRELPGMKIASTERLGIHPDWVEAMAFAWLAQRALKGKTGNLPEVTGAKKPRVLGAIYAA